MVNVKYFAGFGLLDQKLYSCQIFLKCFVAYGKQQHSEQCQHPVNLPADMSSVVINQSWSQLLETASLLAVHCQHLIIKNNNFE